MANTFDQIFAADPSNPSNVAQNASVTIFAPGDETMTPLTITDPDGQPIANPLTVNANGFASAFAHATLDRVAWAGGGFTGFFTSYEGMKGEATAARTAAEAASANAAAAAQADLEARIAAGNFKGDPGADGLNGLNGVNGVNGANVLPTQEAIEQALINEGPAKAAVDAKILEKSDPPTKQSFLLGNAMRKLRKGDAVTIACRGDSTTYGYDNVSGDKVAASGAADDGTAHAEFRSPAPYPSVLADRLNEVYTGTVTVLNQGYSGDSVGRGLNHWPINRSADITIISYGINDSRAAWIPEAGNVETYIRNLETMILRDLGWGSAVVLLSPFRIRGAVGDVDVDTFASALNALANKYGIPIIDGASFLINAARNAWSDATHLTTKGYSIIGTRLAAAFIGEGPQRPHRVGPGTKLLARPTTDNFWGNGVSFASSSAYPTPADNTDGQGITADLKANGTGYWSFYTEVPDVVVYPYFYIQATGGTARFEMSLDFGVEQGMNYNDYAVGEAINFTSPASTLAREVTGTGIYHNTPTVQSHEWLSIRVSTPGWHTIKIQGIATGSVGSLNCYTLELLNSRVFETAKVPAAGTTTLAPSALTTGESTMDRRDITSNAATVSTGTLRLTYFTAQKTETVSTVRTIGGSASAVGATLARIGVYEVAVDGGLTLVASTANDTTLWNATSTTFTRNLTASFSKQAGKRYAVGCLVVGASQSPNLCGATLLTADEAAQAPRLAGALFSQTDLPSSVAAGGVGNTSIQIYAAVA